MQQPGTLRRVRSAYEAVDWDQAACIGSVLSWFPAEDGVGVKKAVRDCLRVCSGCPIRIDCLRFALLNSEPGIWGGTTHKERQRRRHTLRRLVARQEAA